LTSISVSDYNRVAFGRIVAALTIAAKIRIRVGAYQASALFRMKNFMRTKIPFWFVFVESFSIRTLYTMWIMVDYGDNSAPNIDW